MKIWYQSFVDPQQQAGYFDCLKQVLAAWAGPEFRYDLHGISPPDVELNRITEFRCSAQVIRNAITAQQQGYDAFAIGHFQDGGLYEARAAVDIPVLALGEASMLFACTLGRKIALVTINPIFIPMHEEQIIRYGLQNRIVGVTAMNDNPTDLVRAFSDAEAFERTLGQFRAEVQPLIASGAEVIIPAGGLPALLFSRVKEFKIGDAIVLNPIAVLAKTAEMTVQLAQLTGMRVSRASTFAKPSEKALREFLEN